MAADTGDAGVGVLGGDLTTSGPNGIDVVHLHGVVVHHGHLRRCQQDVVMVGGAAEEVGERSERVGHPEAETIHIEGAARFYIGGAEHHMPHAARRLRCEAQTRR